MALTKVTSGLISADASSVDLNIDAGTLYIDATNNRVGIGQTSPAYNLDVYTTAAAYAAKIKNFNGTDAGGGLWIDTRWNTAGNRPLKITSNNEGTSLLEVTGTGLVGIGTATPSDELDISSTSPAIRLTDTTTAGLYHNIVSASDDLVLSADAGNVGANTEIEFHIDGSEKMRIDSSGKVGIGTTSPSELLHLTTSSGNARLRADNGTVTAFSGIDSANTMLHGTSTAHDVRFITSDTERMRIDSSGNVGIGTGSPAYILDVVDTTGNAYISSGRGTQSQGEVGFKLAGGTSGGDWYMYQPTSSNDLRFYQGSDKVTINTSGNVGIGTTSPSYKLEVSDAVKFDGQIRASTGSAAAPAYTFHADNTLGMFRNPNVLGFAVAGSERMRIDGSGNVGIGTTSPTAKIHSSVTGDGTTAKFVTTGLNYIYIDSDETGGQEWSIRTAGTGNYGSAAGDLNFVNSSGGYVMYFDYSAGTIVGDFVDTSDIGLKENITDTTDGLEKLLQLQPRKFDWKDENRPQQVNGFIAQEVETVLPNEVTGDDYDPENPEHGRKGLNTSGILAVAVKAIQEQQTLIEQLQAEVALLKGE